MNKKGLIFDLDGVIVDTAHFHFLAWKNTSQEIGFDLTEELNEELKGVSRIDSLQKILDWAGVSMSNEKFNDITYRKNEEYLSYVAEMTINDILPGVRNFIQKCKESGHTIALGSASKNARTILEKVELIDLFDVIVDGTNVKKAKPDPEVFLAGANLLGIRPECCIVFEDSSAGITAANTANMISVGLGSRKVLGHADHIYANFTEIETNFIEEVVNKSYT